MRHYNSALFSDPPSLTTCVLTTCIMVIPAFAGVSHSTEISIPDDMYLHSMCLLHAHPLISLQHFPYYIRGPPIIISSEVNIVRGVNIKCLTTVMVMDHSWKASFRQGVTSPGSISISHKLVFLLALTWMFLLPLLSLLGQFMLNTVPLFLNQTKMWIECYEHTVSESHPVYRQGRCR